MQHLVTQHADAVGATLASLTTKLPTVVDATRLNWTIALAQAALDVPGDYVETGVFRGGTSIVMMRVLDRAGSSKRHWACDSFKGIPKPTREDRVRTMVGAACLTKNATAGSSSFAKMDTAGLTASCSRGKPGVFKGQWYGSREGFEQNLARFAVTTQRLRIVPGWFNESLPPAGLKSIAFLRVDGDLYASTRDALERLEPLVSEGGFVYIDDYGSFRGCAAAVDEYRAKRGSTETLHPILGASRRNRFQALWWQKSSSPKKRSGFLLG